MNPQPLGYVFSEELREAAGQRAVTLDGWRVRVFWAIFFISFLFLTFRLTWLAVIQGSRNRLLSEENRIVARRIQAPRGVIMDRNGEVLAINVPVYKVKNPECTVFDADTSCREFIEITREEALERRALGREEVMTFVGRQYLLGPEIAHVVGYVGEIDAQELQKHPEYGLGDLFGKTGVELFYEESLHGKDGAELIEVDASSVVVREVAKREPVAGADLQLSIDSRLQKIGYELFGERVGGLISMNPTTGEILTLVSKPSFDPNDVSSSLARDDQPFFNRAIGGLYPPGSVFKIVTATAGLEEGKITASTEIEDTGEIRIGAFRYGNWYFDQYGRTEGPLNLVRAIKRSNDIFFYRVGELVGPTMLSEWGKAFGFGRVSGIDLPGEAEGLVPSPLWKEKMRGERWFLGNTYHFAIGQSDLQATPLQVAQMTAVVANGGKLCLPQVRFSDSPADCQELMLDAETISLVTEGMVEACRSEGTAFPFFNFSVSGERIEVGCKTGTAEYSDPKGRTHAWFTVFAPAQNPEIVVSVLLEGAGEGSYQAAPVAKEFLEYYFSQVADEE